MWSETRFCWDFDRSQPRHFPAGTYDAQVQRPFGQVELELMALLWRCWLIFRKTSLDKWSDDDMDFAAWVAAEPVTRPSLDELIEELWQ